MAGTELGQAYVQIMPSAKGIGKSIREELDSESSGAGESAGKSIVSGIKKLIVAAGIGKMIGSALTSGGELEQNLGGTEAVFGKYASAIQASAQDAYKNMGLSASDYMATANKMGSLFQGSGLTQQQALDMSSQAMQRAADVASVMGVDTTMAMESIAGAAKGNFTMMDNLGVAMNATTLQAYALEKGVNFDWNTATQAEKSELAMKMFMDRTNQYSGNFAKESEQTFSGSLSAMQSSWQNMLGGLATGQDIGPLLKNLGDSVVTFTKNLLPMVSNIVTQLPKIIVELFSTAGPQLIGAGVEAVSGIVSGIGQSLPTLIPMALDAVLTIVDTLIENIPALIDSGMQLLVGLANGILVALPTLIDKIPIIVDGLVTALTNNIPLIISTGVVLLTALVKNLPLIISSLVKAMPKIISSIVSALGSGFSAFVSIGGELMAGLGNGIANSVGGIIKKAKETAQKVVDSVKKFFGVKSPSRVFMQIGSYLDEGLAEGISDNVRPITKAMEDVSALTTRSFESDLAFNAASNLNRSNYRDIAQPAAAIVNHVHTGKVRVEAVNDEGVLWEIKEMIIDDIRQGARG